MLSCSSFNQYSAQNSIHWLLYHITIIETMDSVERRLNPFMLTIINPWKEYRPSRGSNSEFLFSSLQCYWLSFGASRHNLRHIQIECFHMQHVKCGSNHEICFFNRIKYYKKKGNPGYQHFPIFQQCF